jgi:hypothetical protein
MTGGLSTVFFLLTLAITWPQREKNVSSNLQVAAQVHGIVG